MNTPENVAILHMRYIKGDNFCIREIISFLDSLEIFHKWGLETLNIYRKIFLKEKVCFLWSYVKGGM